MQLKVPTSVAVILTFMITFMVQQGRLNKYEWENRNLKSSLTLEQEATTVFVDSLVEYQIQLKYTKSMLRLFTDSRPVTFTAYNALAWQTDDTPNITASNKRIHKGVVALSREQLRYYGHKGGEISWGDTVLVVMPLVVEDTMAKRHSDWADVFMEDYQTAVAFGKKQGHVYHGSYASLIDG